MRIAVVRNPTSGDEEVEQLREELPRSDVRWFETTEDDPGVGQTASAVEWGAEVVIACGGDGTVRASAQGLLGSETALAVLPTGTGNLLVRNLGLPSDPAEVVAVIESGDRMTIDVGTVEGEVFNVMAGAGLDAVVMSETSSESKERFGVLSYVLQAVGHAFDAPMRAAITTDRGERLDDEWVTLLAGNLGRLPGGLDLFPDAEPRDEHLDLLGLAGGTLPSTVVGTVAALAGGDHDRVLRRRARSFLVEFAEPTIYELDGEARPAVRALRFDTVPAGLTVCGKDES